MKYEGIPATTCSFTDRFQSNRAPQPMNKKKPHQPQNKEMLFPVTTPVFTFSPRVPAQLRAVVSHQWGDMAAVHTGDAHQYGAHRGRK